MPRVQLTLDEKTLAYLRRLVESGECASLSHAESYMNIVGSSKPAENMCDLKGETSGIQDLNPRFTAHSQRESV
jgi:hypothetical protein